MRGTVADVRAHGFAVVLLLVSKPVLDYGQSGREFHQGGSERTLAQA